MTSQFTILAAAALLFSCGQSSDSSQSMGSSRDDARTARMRATFANGVTPSESSFASFTVAGGWTCQYHATTNEIAYRGVEDLTYHTTFSIADSLLDESTDSVRGGNSDLPRWTASYHWTQAGLRGSDGAVSRLIRTINGGKLAVEWLFAPGVGDHRGDPAIGVPNMRALGFAECFH